MKQNEVAKWLKGITILTGIAGLIFFLWVMPMMAQKVADEVPSAALLKWPGILYGWGIGVICYAILYQFWKVCVQIGCDNSFSEENAVSFARISRFAVALAVMWFAGVVALAILKHLSPVYGFFMLLIALAFLAVAVLAAALSHLVYRSYEMRRENDLTI